MELWENLSRCQKDFVRSLARGSGEAVRIEFHRLSQEERHALSLVGQVSRFCGIEYALASGYTQYTRCPER